MFEEGCNMSVFHSREFFDLHSGTHWLTSGNVVLPGWVRDDVFRSPLRGTFGGFSQCGLPDMDAILAQVDELECKESHITLAPAGHDKRLFAESMNALVRNGYKIECAELNYEREVYDDFLSGISKGNRKCFHHKNHGIPPYMVAGVSRGAYDLLAENRIRNGHSLSMSLDDLIKMHNATRSVVSFYMGDNSAAAITIRLSPDILYVYAWGDVPDQSHSPTVRLAGYIYEWCLANGIQILDIGTSTEKDGTPNYGLMAFKERLGFTPSLKLTMVKYA